MPELPEVETVVRAIRPRLLGRKLTGYRNRWPRRVQTGTPEQLRDRLVGQTVEDVYRRGKYIVISLREGDTLILHLRMTGHLSVVPADAADDPYVHDFFDLDDGMQLRFRDPRKFGTVALVGDEQQIFGKLGPEPLQPTFTADALQARIAGRSRGIKALLLDQSFVAGVGNIYADEALFRANIDPRRSADSLSEDEIVALQAAIQEVLRLGIERQGASFTTYRKPDGEKGAMQQEFTVFRRTGEPCFECGTPIERIRIAQRSTHFCANCQR